MTEGQPKNRTETALPDLEAVHDSQGGPRGGQGGGANDLSHADAPRSSSVSGAAGIMATGDAPR